MYEKETTMKRWYRFRQNNSGGVFVEPAVTVYARAASADEANVIVQDHGVYFFGVDHGIDCYCCGDRWYYVTEDDAYEEVPSVTESDALAMQYVRDDSIRAFLFVGQP
jgi:hypothetical protein